MVLPKLFFILCAVVCVLMTGCRRKEVAEVKEAEKVSFTLKDFSRTDSLVSEEVSVPTHPSFSIRYSLVRDSLVLMSGALDTAHCLHVYNLHTEKILARHLKLGSGEDEFQRIAVRDRGWRDSPVLYLSNASDYCFYKLHIDSLLDPSFRLKESDKIYYPILFSPTSLVELGNDEFLVGHLCYGDHPEYYNDAPPFIRFTKGDYSAKREKVKFIKYSVSSIFQEVQFYNPQTKQFWGLNIFLDIIRIHDSRDTRLVKELRGPYHFSPQYKTKERYDGHISVFFDGRFLGYTGYCLTDQYVYLLFANQCYPQTPSESLPIKYQGRSEVYQLDWEGNLIHRYVLDRFAVSLDLDEKEEYFYCTVPENRRHPKNTKWVRYKIK